MKLSWVVVSLATSACISAEVGDDAELSTVESAVLAGSTFNDVLDFPTAVGYGTDFHWTINKFRDNEYDLGIHNDVSGKYTHFCVVYHCSAEGDHAQTGVFMIRDHANFILKKRNGSNCPNGTIAKGRIYVDNKAFAHCPI